MRRLCSPTCATPRPHVRRRARTRLDTIVALTASDLRARYGRGRARVVKWLLDPFFAVGVYLVLVTVVLDRPGEAPGLSIACAVVPFQLVITSIIERDRDDPGAAVDPPQHVVRPDASAARERPHRRRSRSARRLVLLALLMLVYGVAPTAAVALDARPRPGHVRALRRDRVPDDDRRAVVPRPAAARDQLRADAVLRRARPHRARPGAGERAGLARDQPAHRPVRGLPRRPALRALARGLASCSCPLAWTVVVLAAVLPLYRSEQRQLAKMVEEE